MLSLKFYISSEIMCYVVYAVFIMKETGTAFHVVGDLHAGCIRRVDGCVNNCNKIFNCAINAPVHLSEMQRDTPSDIRSETLRPIQICRAGHLATDSNSSYSIRVY